jgi:hypothetical protein
VQLIVGLTCVAAACAGCDKLFGINELPYYRDAALDSIDSAPCGGALFRDPVRLDDFAMAYGPTLSDNRLELFYSEPVNARRRLRRASRGTPTAMFSVDSVILELDIGASDSDPSLSADALTMVFASDRGALNHAWQSFRPSVGATFSTPLDLNNGVVYSQDLSGDALTLYFDDGNALQTASRSSPWGPFGAKSALTTERITSPTVSDDGAELFYSGTDGIHRRTRPDSSGLTRFLTSTDELIGTGSEPDLTRDGKTLIFTGTDGFLYMRERCE